MPTRRALVAAMIPAVVVGGIFWLWLNFPPSVAAALGGLFGVASLLVTNSVYDRADDEMLAWHRAAPDLAELDAGVGLSADADRDRATARRSAGAGSGGDLSTGRDLPAGEGPST